MLNKEKLLSEIFKKTEYFENFFYGKFVDSETEKRYLSLMTEEDKYKSLFLEISTIVLQIAFLLIFIKFSSNFYLGLVITFIVIIRA